MRKLIITLVVGVILAAVAIAVFAPGAIRAWAKGQHRTAPRMPTLTTLPAFPKLPTSGWGLSKEQKNAAIQTLVNDKVATYPTNSSRSYRAGKFTSTGIFGGFPPTEDQIARIAPHYDDILFGAARKDFIPRFKKYNPDLTFFIYVDSGLNPGFAQSDAGGVDAENLDWVLQHHSDWILKDKDGGFIRSGASRLGNKGEYWPDPGNPGWQNYFAEKVIKLVRETGGQWTGVLLDQFMGTADGYERYAGAQKQIKYPTDEAFQAAQLQFLKAVAAKIRLPIIVNMEGASIIRRPAFVAEVANVAGGAENEIFPEEMPIEDLRPYLETVQSLPPQIRIRINSKPAGLAGNIDRTLFAYYCYLLIGDRNRNVFWTYKEGTSDVPHYWYREFDLDLGKPKGNIQFGESIWSREFENALVLVNAGKRAGEFRWDALIRYSDVNGTAMQPPLVLKSRTAILLIKNLSILR
ncbi:MAG: hypothetical protein HYY23_05165 [Verrucomicrobia bacterium]|nr:hypothetical protein [Verrucomicrobiota bacterium]